MLYHIWHGPATLYLAPILRLTPSGDTSCLCIKTRCSPAGPDACLSSACYRIRLPNHISIPTASGNSDLRPEQGSAKVASKAASFTSQVDDPHYSSSHAGSVNVHGWWLDDHDNFTGMKARVTVYLWAKKGSQWVQVNKIPTKKNPVTVYAGGGGGKRASGSVSCRSHKPTWYHGQVDVDIIDAIDTSNRPNSHDVELNCQPW